MQHTLSLPQGSDGTSHAAKVLRALGRSVRTTMQHILLATDGSDTASRAADVATALAAAMEAKLSIMTVRRGASGSALGVLAQQQRNLEDAVDPEQILESAEERARHAGVPDVRVQPGKGDPAEVIIESARREKVDAIVVGKGGLVSQKISNLAPCIVIVVPRSAQWPGFNPDK